MQASLKLGLAFAASALWSAAYGQSAVTTPSDTGLRTQLNTTQQRQAPDTSFGSTVRDHAADEAAGAAKAASMGGSKLDIGGGSKPPLAFPDVSKVPAPPGSGPVPIPYPSTPLDVPPVARTPLPVKIEPVKTPLPVVRPVQPPSPTPAWPSKIESIGIKQSR